MWVGGANYKLFVEMLFICIGVCSLLEYTHLQSTCTATRSVATEADGRSFIADVSTLNTSACFQFMAI